MSIDHHPSRHPSHHPSGETLFRHAAGSLPAGPGLVLTTHLSVCPLCRERLAGYEAVGGVMLEETAPLLMAPDALSRVLARLDAPAHTAVARAVTRMPDFPAGIAMPGALLAREIGAWHWFGPGRHFARVQVPEDLRSTVILLRVAAGRRLPAHTHVGGEYTQVLHGRFSDLNGHYRPGDLSETDESIDHQPVVDMDGECICLAALEGSLRLTGPLGRLIAPFM